MLLFCLPFTVLSQTNSAAKTENKLWKLIKEQLDYIYELEPEEWNEGLVMLSEYLNSRDSTYGKWLNDLNLEFKTFQNQESEISSLGFGYDINFERANVKEKKNLRNGRSVAFETKGNVAFNKNANPYNFLNSKLSLNLFHTGGGVEITNPNLDLVKLANMRRELAMKMSVDEIRSSEEWEILNSSFKIRNSFIIKYDVNAGIESDQSFREKQSTVGVRLGLGLKSWDNNSTAAKLNILDYPFELVRKLSKYQGTIHKGVTIPSLLFGFDYVTPIDDSIRELVASELKAYPRLNFEIGFRTIAAEYEDETIYFNAAYKMFKEINPSIAVKESSYDLFNYLTLSLTTTSGMYVSYSFGKLPFDRNNDVVYELGFQYKFE